MPEVATTAVRFTLSAEVTPEQVDGIVTATRDVVERLWAEEAVRRNAELDSGAASMRDAEDVFRDAKARIASVPKPKT